MKKIAIYTALTVAAMGMTSCDHFLNENRYPLDQQTNIPEYWNNEANVSKQCDNLYTNFVGYGWQSDTDGLFYFQCLTDNQASGVGGGFVNWSFTNIPSASSTWNKPYEIIRQCNTIINNTNGSTLADATKAKYVGIARMMRAWNYYKLVRAYGDVPYIDQILDTTSPELYGERTDRDVVMDKVYEDLKYAAENIGGGSATTWSSDLAYAMMSQICLYEGAYSKYRTVEENYKAADLTRANKFFGYVVEAGDKLMAKGYSLNDSYRANYNSVSLAGNPEMIFYKAYKQATLTHNTIRYTVASTKIAGLSKDAFDAYLFVDGKPLSSTSCNTDDAAKMKKGEISAGTLGDVLSLEDVLAVRDQRLYETIDTVVCYGTSEEGLTYSRAGSSQLSSSSGYLVRKFDNTDIPVNFRTGSNYTCAPVYWLAVIYCDYAEAKAELGALDDNVLNNTLNKLYARAGLPSQTKASLEAINDPQAAADGISSLLFEVRRCRRCETMLDADLRYWDLQRWHQLDKLDTTKNPNIRLGANLKNSTEPYKFMAGDYMKAIENNERIYDKREYLYPIPSGQIALNGKLEQQPNWAN